MPNGNILHPLKTRKPQPAVVWFPSDHNMLGLAGVAPVSPVSPGYQGGGSFHPPITQVAGGGRRGALGPVVLVLAVVLVLEPHRQKGDRESRESTRIGPIAAAVILHRFLHHAEALFCPAPAWPVLKRPVTTHRLFSMGGWVGWQSCPFGFAQGRPQAVFVFRDTPMLAKGRLKAGLPTGGAVRGRGTRTKDEDDCARAPDSPPPGTVLRALRYPRASAASAVIDAVSAVGALALRPRRSLCEWSVVLGVLGRRIRGDSCDSRSLVRLLGLLPCHPRPRNGCGANARRGLRGTAGALESGVALWTGEPWTRRFASG